MNKVQERWRKRNYKVIFHYDYSERIDDAVDVEKGDLYPIEYSYVKTEVFWGKRKIEKLPKKVLSEFLEELKYI